MTASTYAEAVWARAERDPDGEVLRVPGGERWTAGRLRDRAAAWAAGLGREVGVGDVVVTCVDASPEAVALTAAVSAVGAVELPLAADAPVDWARHLAATAAACVVVASAARADASPVAHQVAGTTGRPLVLADGPGAALPTHHPRQAAVVPVALPDTAPALIMCTSGTSGRAKAAVLPVGAPIAQAHRVAQAMAYGTHDVLLSCFPWHHIMARNAAVLPALISGARVVMAPRFSASRYLDLIRDERVTAFTFMGATCAMLLAQPATPHDREHHLVKAYGGPAPTSLLNAFADRFGVLLRQAYASTELGDVSTTPVTELRPGAAGRPVADHEVRIVDEDGNAVPPGVPGEIVVRPRRAGIAFLDYLGDPAATRAAWRDGWFRTRDRGCLVDGWLHVEGRTGDVIRRRGVNIDPQQVEDVLLAHPAVVGAAAIAVPSELTEDEVLAVVVLRCDQALDPEALWTHCRAGLPRAAVPRYLSLESDLPHTPTHKLDRAALRRRGLPATAHDADADLPTES